MKNEIIETIKVLSKKAESLPSSEALHLTQAALNLAHVLQVMKDVDRNT